ncbi:MAG: hypothetical protein U0573_04365 [Phycisphaerales bacterium]|nr:hypothetical protein [Planctomycetota bacterium]
MTRDLRRLHRFTWMCLPWCLLALVLGAILAHQRSDAALTQSKQQTGTPP